MYKEYCQSDGQRYHYKGHVMNTIGSGRRHRNLQRNREAMVMQLTNAILKDELKEKFQEVTELKNLLSLMDTKLASLKSLDPHETITAIRKYKAERFN